MERGAADSVSQRDRAPICSEVAQGFMTVEEVGAFLRLGRSSVYKLMDSGEISHAKFGTARRIPRRSVIEFAAQRLRGGSERARCAEKE